MLARKLISLGSKRWPLPWRARNATRFPSSVPTTMASEGSPNGVFTRISRASLSPLIAYSPLPPITPISATGPFAPARALFPFVFFTLAIRCLLGLPVQVHRFDFDSVVLLVQGGRGNIRVMPENGDPAFVHEARHPLALGFQRLERIQIVRHDPGQGDMVTRREQICNKGQLLACPARPELRGELRRAAAHDFHGLHISIVAGNAF